MAYWLVKTEPTVYSFSDLERDKVTIWDGVASNLALKHLREMRKGDEVLVYHSGEEKSVVGIAEVASDPYPDPKSRGKKFSVVDLKPKKRLDYPVSLEEMKKDGRFLSIDLIRIPRLSAMPVSATIWAAVLAFSHKPG